MKTKNLCTIFPIIRINRKAIFLMILLTTSLSVSNMLAAGKGVPTLLRSANFSGMVSSVSPENQKAYGKALLLTQYTLNTFTTGNGTVSAIPNQLSYDSATNVQLTAVPDAGWSFSAWSGDATGSINPLSVTMDGNKNITATFIQITHQLTVQTDGTTDAVVSPSGTFAVNESAATPISVTTVPSGYTFVNWTVTAGMGNATFGDASSASTTVTLTGDATVQANFAHIQHQLTVKADATAGAVVSPSGTFAVNEGAATPISVTTVPAGYTFVNWTVTAGIGNATFGDASSASTTVTLTGDATVQANFAHITRQLTLQTDGTAGAVITPSSPATVNDGASTPISVTVPSGYTFAGWTVTAGPSYAAIANASLASTSVTLTGGNSTLQANFVHTTRQLTLQTDGTAGAVITPSSPATVNDGASTPISVTVPSGYTFAGWTVTAGPSYAAIANASLASTSVTLTGGNSTVQANFAHITRQLTLQTDGTARCRNYTFESCHGQ